MFTYPDFLWVQKPAEMMDLKSSMQWISGCNECLRFEETATWSRKSLRMTYCSGALITVNCPGSPAWPTDVGTEWRPRARSAVVLARWPVDRNWNLLGRAWGNGAGRVRNDGTYAWICTNPDSPFQRFPFEYKWLSCIENWKFQKPASTKPTIWSF